MGRCMQSVHVVRDRLNVLEDDLQTEHSRGYMVTGRDVGPKRRDD